MAFDKLDSARDQSSKPPTSSMPNSTSELLRSRRLKEIGKLARVLFLSYPTTDYDDPNGALATYISVLEGYSDAIVAFVTSPKTGLQRRSKFAPRVAELVAACDDAATYIAKVDRYKNWGSQNEPLAIEGPQEPKLTIAELKAKYGPTWGIDQTDGAVARQSEPVPTWDDITKAYGKDPSRLKALTETEFMMRKSTRS